METRLREMSGGGQRVSAPLLAHDDD